MTENTQITSETADAATEKNVVDLEQTLLLGVFLGDRPRAILRYPGGRIDTVTPGDRTRAGQVVAITENAVILNNLAGTLRLEMPAG